MDESVGITLLVALGITGALRLIPLMLEDIAAAVCHSLRIVADVVKAYRCWRADLWPRPADPVSSTPINCEQSTHQ